jgi:uncharacterized membrane protein YfcA
VLLVSERGGRGGPTDSTDLSPSGSYWSAKFVREVNDALLKPLFSLTMVGLGLRTLLKALK